MRLSYNGVEFEKVLLNDLKMSADKDPTGTDTIYTRVELGISFQWNPFATSSTPSQPVLQGGGGPIPNDSLGLSVRNLRERLNAPRKLLKLAFGGDETFQCPESDSNGQRRCDPGYGPQPEVLSLSDVIGDKNGLGKWRVVFWVTDTSNILLSNRWTVRVETNSAGVSRRLIDGWAQCRADFAGADQGPILTTVPGFTPRSLNGIDDFRRWLICPVASGYYRASAQVTVNEINTIAHYQVADYECMNPMGADGAGIGAVHFEGEMTAGSTTTNNTHWKRFMASVEEAAFGPLAKLAQIPVLVANGWVKVTGTKTADKALLTKLALGILQDRFPSGTIITIVCTQGFGRREEEGRWVKVALTFLPSIASYAMATFGAVDFVPLMNTANDILPVNWNPTGPPRTFPGGIPPNETDPAYKNYNLAGGTRPNGHANPTNNDTGSRGSWLGALLVQTLQEQGQPPAIPPDNVPAKSPNLV